MNNLFRKFATIVSNVAGRPLAFVVAVLIIAGWAISGPVYEFSNTWQLFINTFTTIVTLLMVFLIQNTQNRDSKATHLKLDELLRAIRGARNELIDIEDLPDEVIEDLRKHNQKIQERYYSKKLKDGVEKRTHKGEGIKKAAKKVASAAKTPLSPRK